MEGENLKLALREVGKLIRKNLKQEAKNDKFKASGNLEKSFRYRVEDNELYIFGEQYANALSKGITNKGKYSEKMSDNLIRWAKTKGMRPMFRQYEKGVDGKYKPTGKFRKVYESSWKSLGFVLAASISGNSPAGKDAKNPDGGISKRFEYKGSGFIKRVQEQTKEQIKTILKEGYRKDILLSLDKLKSIN
jgi:hypothetical protein